MKRECPSQALEAEMVDLADQELQVKKENKAIPVKEVYLVTL